jgi:ferric-dicitrate binding protein FerR (iron transport regulator)
MSTPPEIPEDLRELVEDYLSGAMDEARLLELESRLRSDPEARWHFVRYCRMDTDLHLEARAQQAGQRALRAIDQLEQGNSALSPGQAQRRGRRWFAAAAAAVLAALGIWWWSGRGSEDQVKPAADIAWLINAQDCQWAGNLAPAGDMRAGKVLRLQRGLAEIGFQNGARVVLEGPASVELLTGNSARLLHGKLSAKVPASAKGFQITSPHGKVVDLGTEFAMAVAADGTTDVYVFAGKVEAYAGAAQAAQAGAVSVQEKQAARIDAGGVALKQAEPGPEVKQFVRAIVPPPQIVPRVFALDFRQAVPDTLLDATGLGTGFTHRLPGTGMKLLPHDENLSLDAAEGQLALKTTNTDINTSYRLAWGEYLGVRLADHGFTGKEDFAVTAVVPNIPELPRVGQFGLYAGLHHKENIRGGMISTKEPGQYKQFLVQNHEGKDADPHYVGLGFPGEDLRLTLRRSGTNYSLTVENLTTGASTTITMRQPEFLENDNDFYVGFFGANTQSKDRRTLMLKEFKVTVWTVVTAAN